MNRLVSAALAAGALLAAACGGDSSPGSSSGSSRCNSVDGTWNAGAATGIAGSNPTCTALAAAAGSSVASAGPVTITTSGTSITATPQSGSPLTGTLDRTTCKASFSVPIDDTVSVPGGSVTVTGTEKNDVTFNSNSSLTAAWTITITSATGLSGFPCTITATQTATK